MPVPARTNGQVALPEAFREAIRSGIEGTLELPMFPETAARVLAACKGERSGLDEIVDLITHDQSLAAHLLRVANSVAYAARVPALSLQQAVGRLGLGTVSNIAVAATLRERVFSVSGGEERIRKLWRHSAATACYAQEIAEVLRRDLNSAFLCGLLHDVGMPIVLQVVCDLEREGIVPAVSPALMDAALMEFHCELGARLASAWQLGPWIGLVIRHHHDPAGAKYHPDEIPMVALADALAYLAVDPRLDEEDFSADPSLLDALQLREGALHSLLRKRERVLQAIEAFS